MFTQRIIRLCGVLVLGAAWLVSVPPGAQAAGETVVSLTFNDGLMSQYTNARPVLQAHAITGTFYVSSKVIEANAPGYMAKWHVDDLYRDGNEVGGLTKDHIDLTDPGTSLAYKQDQVCGDKTQLTSLGYDPRSFSYPFAAVNPAAESIVQGCGYLSGRTVGGLYAGNPANAIPPTDPFWISTVGSPPTPVQLGELQDAVNAASSNGGGWVPIAFDNVCGASGPDYDACMASYHPIDSGVLSAFLDWLQNGAPAGTSVARVRDVMGAPAQPVLPPRPTVVSLTFDDGLKNQYAIRNLFKDRHLHGTFYLNSGTIDANDEVVMSWGDARNLAADGNDVGGHTKDHEDLISTSTSFDFKWHQACDDRARLQAQRLSPQHFAYPFAGFNAEARSIVEGCGYQTGRTGGSLLVGGPLFSEAVPPPDPFTIKTLGTAYDGPVTLQAMQDAVNGVVNHAGGWLPMVFHDVCKVGSSTFNACMAEFRPVTDKTLAQFMDWALANASRGISIKSVAEVLNTQATPNVQITAPVSGALTQPSPVISGTAATGGGEVTISIYSGPYSTGTPVTTALATNNAGTWTLTVPGPLADGTYTVQAKQTAGGLTGISPPVTFVATNDTIGPAIQILAPLDGSRVGTSTPLISGRAGTAAGDNSAVTVRIYNGTVTTGSPRQTKNLTAATDGSFSFEPGSLPDGVFTVVASQSDIWGNTGTSQVAFTVDRDKPLVRITSPANDSDITTVSFNVTGTAGTAAGDLDQVTLSIMSGSTTVRTSTVTAVGGAYTVTISGLAAGTYTLRAGQADSAGNVGLSNSIKVKLLSSMKLSDVTPDKVAQGASGRVVTFKGEGFTTGVVASFAGTGITMTSTTVVSPKELRVAFDVAPDAQLGHRDAIVSLPGTIDAVRNDGLTVTAGP